MSETKSTNMTMGEQRVHLNFNPSAEDKIGTFKRMMADAIDFCNSEIGGTDSFESESARCFSIAMTNLETATMYAVKGISKNS